MVKNVSEGLPSGDEISTPVRQLGICALFSFLADNRDYSGLPTGVVVFCGPGPRVSESSTMHSERSRAYAVILVGSSSLLTYGLARCLDGTNFQVVAISTAADQVVIPDASQHGGLVLVIDGCDLESALRDVRSFRALHESGRVAVLLDEFQWTNALAFFEAGAQACFPKSVAAETFVKSLELIMLGEVSLPKPASSLVASQDKRTPMVNGAPARLSPQEERVLEHLISGTSNKGIARALDITLATTKVHIKAILRKLGLNNRTQAAVWALGRGEKGDGAHPTGPPSPNEKTSTPPE